MIAIALVALAVRFVYPTADPPSQTTVGVVWHDEGAWVHNARNKALWGHWRQDQWNPMFIAPVFTGLEYISFAMFGVGVWQARLVSELTGFASVLLLAFGVRRIANREAAIIAASLLATHYVYVMWNRAALMEGSMAAFIVASWYCYVRAQDRSIWGLAAAACALLAYFTKAAAIFFVAALALDAIIAIAAPTRGDDARSRDAARTTLLGLVGCGLLALAVFVGPHWSEYRFYNWQMSVTRKPSYDLRSVIDRVTWFPVLHDIFTRSWFLIVVSLFAIVNAAARWRTVAAPERLLVWWVVVGAAELMLHDVGNERRFIFFIPVIVALTALVLARDRRLLVPDAAALPRTRLLIALPLVAFGFYVIDGSLARLVRLYEPGPGVRLGAALALLSTMFVYAAWPRLRTFLSSGTWTASAAMSVAALVSAGQIAQFVQWAPGRTYKNYLASVELGRILAPGTLVHGKLANGLSLENRIKPVFVGREFGNYDDRKQRDDVRYILTYVAPYIGYEGRVIQDVIAAYPNRTIIRTFEVAETATGHDRAVLIDKFGSGPPERSHPPDGPRPPGGLDKTRAQD
jgi:4-amino-4-deoxy-L-arabinose transferase-like glycosyltransferase